MRPSLLLLCFPAIFAISSHALVIDAKSLAEIPSLEADVEIDDVKSVPDELQFVTHLAKAKITGTDTFIEIKGPGGELGETGMFLSGFARPYKGGRYHARLKENEDGTYSVVGFENGLVDLNPRRRYSRNRTDGSNGQGNGPFLFWHRNFFPIPYAISAETFADFPDFPAAIDASFRTWRNPNDSRIEFQPIGCTSVSRNENDGVNAVILLTDKWPFDTSAIAITRNFYVAGDSARSGLILDSDILLNGVNHSFTTTGESGAHDVQNIVTHEVGHFLGFGHEVAPADEDATMFAVASAGETNKRTLHDSELGGLVDAYPGAGEKNAMAGILCEIPTGAMSCAAVHGRALHPSTFWAFLYLLGLLGAGRAVSRFRF